VRLTGELVSTPHAKQLKELQVSALDLLGNTDPTTYPLQKQTMTTEYLRNLMYFRARTDNIAKMLRLRAELTHRIHSYFAEKHEFLLVNTPVITQNDAEGAGEVFEVSPKDFFSNPSPESSESTGAFLTVSSQLHLEAFATAIGRVYTLSPCFRAERSDTSRHLAEFWMLEAEWVSPPQPLPEADTPSDTSYSSYQLLHSTSLLEGLIREVAGDHIPSIATAESWPRISYTEAIAQLQEYQSSASSADKFQHDSSWGSSLSSQQERYLARNGPIFVTDYPKEMKPFYMWANDDGKTVACFDLLIPRVGELAGGSVRETRYDVLKDRMSADGMLPDGSTDHWYLETRAHGVFPHSGFGLGFERLISWILSTQQDAGSREGKAAWDNSSLDDVVNVRECIPIPRWAGRCPM